MENRAWAARSVVSGAFREPVRPDRVLIKDLVLQARIGIHPHERAPQRVRLNIEVEVRRDVLPGADQIAEVISYEDLIAGIRALIAEGHINLVETLAARIAEICLADPRALRARVRVEKLDVEPDAEAVGVEIERAR